MIFYLTNQDNHWPHNFIQNLSYYYVGRHIFLFIILKGHNTPTTQVPTKRENIDLINGNNTFNRTLIQLSKQNDKKFTSARGC